MNDQDRREKKPPADSQEPPPAGLPSIVPRNPESGLHAALDALRPSAPAPAGNAVPPPSPAPAKRAPERAEPPMPAPPSDAPAEDSAPLDRPYPLVTEDAAAADAGALAAYRAIARRTPPALRRPERAFGAPEARERAELLEHLSERAPEGARARLWIAAAESWQRAAEPGRARTLYQRAETERADDPALLRELRKYALVERDSARVAELLEREAAVPSTKAERALAWLLRAELELCQRADRAAAEHAAEQSWQTQPSLCAALLLYTLHARAGRDHDAAEALRRAATHWPDARAQSALLLLAARLLFRAGEPVAAQVLCQRAHNADPTALDALLCWTRAARERGDARPAAEALERLQGALGSEELGEHALRARARLLDVAGDGAQALQLLAPARTLPGVRLRARLCETTGRRSERRDALERWAEIAGGSERALALVALCELALADTDYATAQRALEQAASADAGSALVRTLQAALARATGGGGAASARAGGDDGERLEAVAHLAADAGGAAKERALLAKLERPSATAAALALDAAVELADWPAVITALAHEARQVAEPERIGLELIRNELLRHESGAGAAPEAAAEKMRAPSSPLAWLQQVHAARDPIAAGTAWLELSALAGGELGAASATLAGDYLTDSGRGREAYERALAALPGYAPACWSLEPILLERDDAPALRRVHAARARATRDPVERAARTLRAAALAGPASLEEQRAAWQELAALSAVDALLCDLRLHVGDEREQLALADALEAAGHGARSALADLAALRAAVAYEHGNEPARAAVLYRSVSDREGDAAAHADHGLERTLAAAGLSALLADQLERARGRDGSAPARRAAAERLALHHSASGDEARAVRAFRELCELDRGHVSALRALQRRAMRESDLAELRTSAEALAHRTRDPRERAAQLRLAARARELSGASEGPVRAADERELGLWHAIELERVARKRDDAQLTAHAVLLLCAQLPDANQRASYALRAAEALEPVSASLAAAALEPHALAASSHPIAHEQLGRLRLLAGDPGAAALHYEHAARAAPSPQRGARLWYRAALLWQDMAPNGAHVRAALERVVEIDPLYRDAFARLRQILARTGDSGALAALCEARIAAGGEPRAIAALHLERARLLLELGDQPQARAALAEALALDPHRADALRTAADMDIAAGRLNDAAETLIQLARVSQDREVLRACFLELGRIYSEHIPDLRRAEIAYARAVALDPKDVAALEKLMRVLCRKRDHDKALRACDQLIELARDDVELDRRTVERAAILEDMGETRRAERTLNVRRERSPGAPAVLAALVELYARQRDHTALAVHLDRSIHALRDALIAHPGDAQRWNVLCDVLARRGRTDAAACAGALARELGAADEQVEKLAAPRTGIGVAALEPETVARVWPGAGDDPARPLLRWLEPVADALLPAPPLQRIDAPTPGLQTAVRAARAALGLPEITLFTIAGASCLPLRTKPLSIAIGRQLLARCSEEELCFLLVRAAAVARLGWLVAARSDPSELDTLLAVARDAEPEPEPEPEQPDAAPDDTRKAEMRMRIDQNCNPKRRGELTGLASRVAFDGFTLHSHALELGGRVALAATGALGPALCALAACTDDESASGFDQHDPLLALEDAQARALLRFALSEAYMDLHTRARSSTRPGAGR